MKYDYAMNEFIMYISLIIFLSVILILMFWNAIFITDSKEGYKSTFVNVQDVYGWYNKDVCM